MGPHRADAVLAGGTIVEFQQGYLDAEQILEREKFYGEDLVWLYRSRWMDRVVFEDRHFWWKHAAPSMMKHQRALWWHLESAEDPLDLGHVMRVYLRLNEQDRVVGSTNHQGIFPANQWYPLPTASEEPEFFDKLLSRIEIDSINDRLVGPTRRQRGFYADGKPMEPYKEWLQRTGRDKPRL